MYVRLIHATGHVKVCFNRLVRTNVDNELQDNEDLDDADQRYFRGIFMAQKFKNSRYCVHIF